MSDAIEVLEKIKYGVFVTEEELSKVIDEALLALEQKDNFEIKKIKAVINELDDLLQQVTGEDNKELIIDRIEKLDNELIILIKKQKKGVSK